MKKNTILKSGLLSAMLVAIACSFIVPAVSANIITGSIQSNTYYGEGVGSGVQGNWDGSQYTWAIYHVGRWLVAGQTRQSALYFTLYANGSPMSSSTSSDSYDPPKAYGSYSSIGASAYAYFYDSRVGTFRWDSGNINI